MNTSMWVRPLTPEERNYLRKSDLAEATDFLDEISIMGCDDEYRLRRLDVKLTSYREYIGDGQYIDEVRGGGAATGGKKAPIIWSRDSYQGYLFRACETLDIPVFHRHLHLNVLYFESIYADAFLKVFIYVEHALSNWYNNRPALVRWFGAMAPDIGTKEEIAISNEVRRILLQTKQP